VLCDDDQDLFVFLREDANERVLVALNAGSEPARLELPEGRWRAAYGKHASGSRARVPAIDGLVLVEEQ
jgi:pullulanase/glycogen debranching enzyme